MIWKSIEHGLSDNARTVLERRYLIKDENGKVVEVPDEMFHRVARAIAQADGNYGADEDELRQTEEQFYSLLTKRDFMPNSPTLMNAGKEQGQLSACFVVPIEDSMESIFDAIKATAMIHKTGGGTGFTFSHLRPKSSRVRTTGGIASGPVSFMRVFDAATQAVKQGGCVAPNTKIATGKGLLKIKDLGPADAPADSWHKYNPHPVAVATDRGVHVSDEFYNHGVSPVRTVKTKNGYKVTGTPQHRLRVIDKDGEYVWRHIRDIEVGDWVALQKDTYLLNEPLTFLPFHLKPHFNSQKINIPSQAAFELGEFIGYLIGDGAISINKRGTGRLILSISDQEKDVASHILKIAKELFGIVPTTQKKKDDLSTNYFFNSANLVNWLRHIGINKPSAARVVVPELVFKAGRQFARGFVRGLFSADGSVTKDGYPSLCTVSGALAEDLQQLLLSLGMPSTISINRNRKGAFGKRPIYQLRIITLEGIEQFRQEIGFISKNKNRRILKRQEKAWEFNDIIPHQEEKLRTIYNGPGRGCAPGKKSRGANRPLYRDLQHYMPNVVAPRNLTRERLRRLAKSHPEIKSDHTLSWFLTNKQFYDRVVELNEGESLTLDLSVPGSNTYIANGFVSHNTRRGANMGILRVDHPDILEFITCKQSDKAITNFNISVAVTDEFMKRLQNDEDYDLINPHTGEVSGQLNAGKVFELITQMAWKNGEPGVIFIDRMNNFNPTPQLGQYESTNPCVTGDTFIPTEGGLVRIKDIVQQYGNSKLRIFIDPRTVKAKKIFGGTSLCVPAKAFSTGKREILRLETKAGYELKLTPEHRVLTERGWVKAEALIIGQDKILINDKGGDFSNNHKEGSDTVVDLEPAGIEEVFDIAEPISHSFIANGCVVHNCGEQILLPYESCNLGSINLSHMVTEEEGKSKVDWDHLETVTHQAVHFLDNVIDMNSFPLPEIEHNTKLTRKIGLGVMGWADILVELGIPYNSGEAIKLAEEVMGFIYNEAQRASVELAKERGAFPAFEGSVYDEPGAEPQRNATLTTIAPTGTISIISGCSSGIEPYFAISFYRKVMDNDKLVEINPYFETLAKEGEFWSEELKNKIAEDSSIQEVEEIPPEVKNIFVTSHDIAPVWHIRMQAAFQKYTDNAVSKTINFPNTSTVDEVRSSYVLAYKSGCKGITVYRDKSREEQVLNTGTVEAPPEAPVVEVAEGTRIAPKPRPAVVHGTTTKVQTGCGNLYVTINEDLEGYPFEVFLQMGKAGGCAASQLEAVGRLVSLAFRAGVDIKSIIDQLAGIRCPSPSWEKGGRIFSCADAIAKVVERRLGDFNSSKISSSPPTVTVKVKVGNVVGVCPDCGGALRHEEGCMICNSCGYSKCG